MSALAAIAILRDAYPRADFPDRTVELYARMLADQPDDEVTAAVQRLIRRSSFLPSIAEIRSEVAEARLELPSTAEALEILERGSLKQAAAEIQASARTVGGRYALMNAENPTTVRAQFRRDYEDRRARAIAEVAGYAVPHAIPPAVEAATVARALPVTERIKPRPVMARLIRRLGGMKVELPTEDEQRDAIGVLRDGPMHEEDQLYEEAERIFAEASDG